jgi:hypothetical protein
MKKYKAVELFSVRVKMETSIQNEIHKLSFPFNLSFEILQKKSNEFCGPGVYIITFKDEVIYIGSYSSTNNKIINERWDKHIQTLTNRGYRIGFNSKSKRNLIPIVFKEYFENESYRFRDTGTVSSIDRLKFAAEYFEEFKEDGNQILKDFCFYYQKIDGNNKAKIIESQLLKSFKTLCNRKSKNTSALRGLKIEKIKELLTKSIMFILLLNNFFVVLH